MKLTKERLKQIIKEELENLLEAEEEYVLERSGVSWPEKFIVSGPASNPKFGSLEKAKVFKSKEAAKSFAADLDEQSGEYVSVQSKGEFK